LGIFLFYFTMELVYMRLRAAMGEQGTLYAYCDDAYLITEPDKMADVLAQAPAIYGKVGLKLGYGLGKTEIILPQGYDRVDFPYPFDDPSVPAPHVVSGFKSCLGVPRHHTNDQVFITAALYDLGVKHDRVLDQVEEVSDEDSFAVLRLLQVCGVSRFGHVLSVVPPAYAVYFARRRDEAVAATLATIQLEVPHA